MTFNKKLAKTNWICQKTWPLGGVAYRFELEFENLELGVKIQNNLVEMITG